MWTILWVGSAAWGATLDVAWAGTGRYVVSTAGWGSASESAADVWIDRPEGGELVAAFVVLAGSPEAGDPGVLSVEVSGSPVTSGEAASAGVGPVWARWGDVTAEAGPVIDALPAGGGALVLAEAGLEPLQTEGVGLIVVWAAPGAPLATAAVSLGAVDLFEGASLAVGVDAAGVTSAELGLAVAFSTGPDHGQASAVVVNGVEVAVTAGGYDDGAYANGALFTLGGEGDTSDGERYDLSGALLPTDTTLAVDVTGPEVDDYLVAAWFLGEGVTLAGASWCGDATVDAGEACDDGNDVDDDACSNLCHLGEGDTGDTGGEAGDTGGDTGDTGGETGDTGGDTGGHSEDTAPDDTDTGDTSGADTSPTDSSPSGGDDTANGEAIPKVDPAPEVGPCGCGSTGGAVPLAPLLVSALLPSALLLSRRSSR